jgi:hypothetical protein
MIVLWVTAVLATAHLLSPVALAWSHSGMREVAQARPGKFIGLPLALLFVALLNFEWVM